MIRDLLARGELAARDAGGTLLRVAGGDLVPVEADAPARVSILAPFDPVVWDRLRFGELWGWTTGSRRTCWRRGGCWGAPTRCRCCWRDKVIGWATCEDGAVRVGYAGSARQRAARTRRRWTRSIARPAAGSWALARAGVGDVPVVRGEQVRLGVRFLDPEADDALRVDADDRAVGAWVAPGISMARAWISRHRTRQGGTEATSSTTKATWPLPATLRNLRLADMG